MEENIVIFDKPFTSTTRGYLELKKATAAAISMLSVKPALEKPRFWKIWQFRIFGRAGGSALLIRTANLPKK
jgi:hypothetical protein